MVQKRASRSQISQSRRRKVVWWRVFEVKLSQYTLSQPAAPKKKLSFRPMIAIASASNRSCHSWSTIALKLVSPPGSLFLYLESKVVVSTWHAPGFLLTRDELTASYAIIRHNIRTYRSAGVVAVVKGKQKAEVELKILEDAQGPADRHEGWRYFCEKTTLQAGTDPDEATRKRQADLEVRESAAEEIN